MIFLLVAFISLPYNTIICYNIYSIYTYTVFRIEWHTPSPGRRRRPRTHRELLTAGLGTRFVAFYIIFYILHHNIREKTRVYTLGSATGCAACVYRVRLCSRQVGCIHTIYTLLSYYNIIYIYR